MAERSHNRSAVAISNAGLAAERLIENTVGQLEDLIAGTRRGQRRASILASTQSSVLSRSLSRGPNRSSSDASGRLYGRADRRNSPFLSTAERPTSAAPTARSMSFYSDPGSSYTANRPRTATARENSTFDDTSAGSDKVSTAVSPGPSGTKNQNSSERRARSPTVRANTNSRQSETPRRAWANISVGGHTVIRPRDNIPPAEKTRTPSAGLSPFSVGSTGSSTPYSSSTTHHDISTARPTQGPELQALRRGRLFGRSSSSCSRDNGPCGVQPTTIAISVAIPLAAPSERTATASSIERRHSLNVDAQSVSRRQSEVCLKTAEAIGSPCGRRSNVPHGPSAVSTEKMVVFKPRNDHMLSATGIPQGPSAIPTDKMIVFNNNNDHMLSATGIPQGPSATSTDKMVVFSPHKDVTSNTSVGEPRSITTTEPHTSCAQTPNITAASTPGREASTVLQQNSPATAIQVPPNSTRLDSGPTLLKPSTPGEPRTSCAMTPMVAWLASEQHPLPKAANSSDFVDKSTKPTTTHFEFGSPTSGSGRQPLTGFDREHWNIARNDNSDPSIPRLYTARESSQDTLNIANKSYSPRSLVPSTAKLPSASAPTNAPLQKPTYPESQPVSPLHTALKDSISPTRGVQTATEVPMSPTPGVITALEASMSPTRGVKTARTPGDHPSDYQTPKEATNYAKTPSEQRRSIGGITPIYTPRPIATPIPRACTIPPPVITYGGVVSRTSQSPYSPGVRRGLFGTPVENRSGETPLQDSAFSASGPSLAERVATMKRRQSLGTSTNTTRTPPTYSTYGMARTMRPIGSGERFASESSPRGSSRGSIPGLQRQSPFITDRLSLSATSNDRKRSSSQERSSRSLSGRNPLMGTPRISSMKHCMGGSEQGSSAEGSSERSKSGRRPMINVPVSGNPPLHPMDQASDPLGRPFVFYTGPAHINDSSMKTAMDSNRSNTPWLSARSYSNDGSSSNEAGTRRQPRLTGSRKGKSGRNTRSRENSRPSFYGSSRRVRKINRRNIRKPINDPKNRPIASATPQLFPQQSSQPVSPDTQSDTRNINRGNKSPPLHTAIDDDGHDAQEVPNLQRPGNIVIHEQNADGTVKLEIHLSCSMNTTGQMKISGRAPSGICPKKVMVNGKEIWTET